MTLTQRWSNAGRTSATLAQHQTSTGSMPRVCWAALNPVNICTMLDQRQRRWADVVQMLYKCYVFAGNSSWSGIAYSGVGRRNESCRHKYLLLGALNGHFLIFTLQIFCFCRHRWRCGDHLPTSVTAGGGYKPTPTKCLLNDGPASPVLASIHSVLFSTSCCRYLPAGGMGTML